MKRRDFLMASSGFAAVTLPGLARAATPCAPPTFGHSTQTVTTACGSASSGSYTTNFPLTENTISEGGRWLNGFTDGVVFKDVRTTAGRAFASGVNYDYDDSWAILNSPSIPNDHFVEVVVYREAGYTAPSSHEIQLQLRGNIDRNAGPYYAPLIEVLMPFGGTNGQIAYQNGQIGGYDILSTGGPGFNPLVTGDVVRAQIVGSSITVRVNGNLAMTATESRRPTGKPGIGFFVRPGGIPEKFCISRFSCGPAT
jgi:hypothetical protein